MHMHINYNKQHHQATSNPQDVLVHKLTQNHYVTAVVTNLLNQSLISCYTMYKYVKTFTWLLPTVKQTDSLTVLFDNMNRCLEGCSANVYFQKPLATQATNAS